MIHIYVFLQSVFLKALQEKPHLDLWDAVHLAAFLLNKKHSLGDKRRGRFTARFLRFYGTTFLCSIFLNLTYTARLVYKILSTLRRSQILSTTDSAFL